MLNTIWNEADWCAIVRSGIQFQFSSWIYGLYWRIGARADTHTHIEFIYHLGSVRLLHSLEWIGCDNLIYTTFLPSRSHTMRKIGISPVVSVSVVCWNQNRSSVYWIHREWHPLLVLWVSWCVCAAKWFLQYFDPSFDNYFHWIIMLNECFKWRTNVKIGPINEHHTNGVNNETNGNEWSQPRITFINATIVWLNAIHG